MASFVVESAATWVGKLLVEEVNFLAEVRDKVEGLKRELERMKSFLYDADRKQYKSLAIRNWISEIRDFAQEAEDVVELYILKVSHKREQPRSLIPWSDLKWLLCCIKDAKTLHSVGGDIDTLIAKFKELSRSSQMYGITSSNEKLIDPYLDFERRFIEQRRTYSHTEDVVIGLDEHVTEVADKMVDGQQKIVVIHGMGGIGKTTLAREVYNAASLKSHFQGFAWAYVSQQLHLESVCRRILLQLIPSKDEEDRRKVGESQDPELLITKLFDVLKKTKCLVVLDDIWSIEDWNCLKHAFPLNDNSCDSKLLVTTRNSEIFLTCPRSMVYYYEAKFLNRNQSWQLLERKAEFNQHNAEPLMVKLGEEMLKHCDGLPLAIVVLGGILATKETLEGWRDVCDNLQANLQGGGQYGGVYEVLALSYYELSYHLKACFLVLGYFPEDFEIPAERVYHLWIAEGIVSPRSDQEGGKRSLEDIAKVYLNELVHKGMVQVVSRGLMGDIKICKLHDLMRDKCLQIAKEENFLQTSVWAQNCEQQHPHSSCIVDDRIRRLAVHVGGSVLKQESLSNSSKSPHLKSLLFFHRGEVSYYQSRGDIPQSLELLRILDFTGFHHISLRSSIGTLIHLRYLSLKGAGCAELPPEIGNLRSLLVLDLRFTGLTMPNVLWKMKSLRQLYVGPRPFYLSGCGSLIEDRKPLFLGTLRHAEIIEGLVLDRTNVEGLQDLSNTLQRLKAMCFDKREKLDPFLKSSSIKSMSLVLGGSILQSHPNMLSGCRYLHRLTTHGGNFLDVIRLPQNLVKLRFCDFRSSKENISILEKLPRLKKLYLESYKSDADLYLHISSNGFPELTDLAIIYSHALTEWTVERGGLPKLQKLEIKRCPRLKTIPDSLPPQVSIICDPCVPGIKKYESRPHYMKKPNVLE